MKFRTELAGYLELAKPRITALLLVVALTSYAIASGPLFTLWGFFVVFASVGSLGAGIFALNHWMERNQDKLMARTAERPIPSGKISEARAFWFGTLFTALGLGLSVWWGNWLTGGIALFVAVSYLALYTPLKYKTAYHTAIGALPGAAPPLAGWAIATGTVDLYAWVLFGVLFLWQFPHFLSIEMMYREDYAKADIKVLPVVDTTGVHVAWQIVVPIVLLIALGVVPVLIGTGTWITTVLAVGLGGLFLVFGIRAVWTRQVLHARHLLRASVIYLPLVFIVLYFRP
ncbi:MAG: heme o synthase [Spirochaetales bacterium]